MARPRKVILDLEGTWVLRKQPLPGSPGLLLGLGETGGPFALRSNNSPLSLEDRAQFARMGLPVAPAGLFARGAFAGRESARALLRRPAYLPGIPSLAAGPAEEGVRVHEEGRLPSPTPASPRRAPCPTGGNARTAPSASPIPSFLARGGEAPPALGGPPPGVPLRGSGCVGDRLEVGAALARAAGVRGRRSWAGPPGSGAHSFPPWPGKGFRSWRTYGR